jgi:hypothetical protein
LLSAYSRISNRPKLVLRKEYGDYFHEIIEGRNTRDNSSLDDETERKDTSGQADSNPTTDDNNSVNVLLGASNSNEHSVLLLSAYSRISNRPKLVLTGRIGAQFNI